MADSFDSYLANHVQRNLLKYAVQRAIFCGPCGDILDIRRAVLAEGRDGTRVAGKVAIQCGACFDKWAAEAAIEDLALLEITDGRPASKQKAWRAIVAAKYAPPVTRAELEQAGQIPIAFDASPDPKITRPAVAWDDAAGTAARTSTVDPDTIDDGGDL